MSFGASESRRLIIEFVFSTRHACHSSEATSVLAGTPPRPKFVFSTQQIGFQSKY